MGVDAAMHLRPFPLRSVLIRNAQRRGELAPKILDSCGELDDPFRAGAKAVQRLSRP